MNRARIIGVGAFAPKRILTNRELEKMVETTDDWIVQRTGIRERHIVDEGEGPSDLAIRAAQQAMERAQVTAEEIDFIVVGTTAGDMHFPTTANLVQHRLGCQHAAAFDMQAGCSGFIYAQSVAKQFIVSGRCRNVVVVGAELLSKFLDWSDRTTCVIFADGAGAVVLRRDSTPGILSTHLHADGSYANLLTVPGSVSGGKVSGRPLLQMDGGGVFKFAVKAMDDLVDEALAANGMQRSQIDWLVPHQANIRIIQASAKKLGLSMEKVVVTVDRHANTSAASIPLALDEAARDGRIRAGQHVLLEAVGGGFTWGAALVKW